MSTREFSRRSFIQPLKDLLPGTMSIQWTGSSGYLLSAETALVSVSDGWGLISTSGISGLPHLRCVSPKTLVAKWCSLDSILRTMIHTGEISWETIHMYLSANQADIIRPM